LNVYLRLRLTCLLLSAICCCRLCLLRVLLDTCPFCFLQYTALPTFSNCSLFFYLEFRSGCAPPPLSWGACHTSATVTILSLSKHTEAGGTTSTFSSQLVHLQFHQGVPLYHPLEIREPTLFSTCLFYFSASYLLFSLVFSLFFPGWGSVSPGGYADLAKSFLWEYQVPLSSPAALSLSSRLGAGIWRPKCPPGFSV
jgi:hypothetical protein